MSQLHEQKWEACLKVIKDIIPLQAFKTWFSPIVPVKLEGDVLTIQVPSHFFYEWLEEHYIGLLKKVIKKELGPNGRLEYSIIMERNTPNSTPYTVKIPTSGRTSLKNSPVSVPLMVGEDHIRNPIVIPGLKKIDVNSNLNPSYSFENFVEGDCNRLARSAGYARSEERRVGKGCRGRAWRHD